jgi:signal peptidase II
VQERRAVPTLRPARPAPGRRRLLLTGGVLAAGVAADWATKLWAATALADGSVIDLVGSFRFRLSHNTGIAFSIGTGRSPVFMVLGLVVTSMLVWMATTSTTSAQAVAFGLVLAGAVGNLGDRFKGGSVVDFIDPQFWPVFNVADVLLFVGGSLLVLSTFRAEATDA